MTSRAHAANVMNCVPLVPVVIPPTVLLVLGALSPTGVIVLACALLGRARLTRGYAATVMLHAGRVWG